MGKKFLIRPMTKDDASEVLRMMAEIVEYENGTDFRLTKDIILNKGFGINPEFGVFLAEEQRSSQICGMAVFYEIPFMHDLKPQLILKWLYVDEKVRGYKLGQLLFKSIANLALEKGLNEFAWHVLEGNSGAERFYKRLGGTKDSEWHRWTIKKENINKLLES